MSAVIPFMRPTARTTSWSQQELAEFYRVEAALVRAGIGIASEHGVSDEGSPGSSSAGRTATRSCISRGSTAPT